MTKSGRVLRTLLLLCLLFCLLPSLPAAAREEDYECAMFPAGVLQVSQIPYGSYSHSDDLATDIVPEGDVFAPFTGKIVFRDSSYGYIVLESLEKVHWADGSLDYMSVGFMHDNDITDLEPGQIIEQGTPFYQAGVRSPSAYITDAHVHLVVIRGKASGLSNPFRGTDFPFDAFFLDTDTEVLVEGWTDEPRYCLNHHAPTDYSGLWVSLESFGSWHIRYDPNGGTGEIPARFKTLGQDFVLSNGAAFRRDGFTLLGWSEDPYVGAPDYALGSVFTEDRPLLLYAVWEPLSWRVSYLAEDGAGTQRDETRSTGDLFLLPASSFSRTGYHLSGWQLEREGGLRFDGESWTDTETDAKPFAPGTSVSISEAWAVDYMGRSFTFRAVWEPVSYTVRYEPGIWNPLGLLVKGSTPDSVHIYGEARQLSDCGFTRRGRWRCTGWSTEKNGAGTFFPAGEAVQDLCTEDGGVITLYAVWERT